MKKVASLIFLFCLGILARSTGHSEVITFQDMEQAKTYEEVLQFAKTIHWLGQAAVRIEYKGHIIYIDPYQMKTSDKADLILITHDHQDHLSLSDIAMIAGSETRFVVAEACFDKLKEAGYKNIQAVVPGAKVDLFGLGITAVPAYNVSRQMHPKNRNYVGYVIDFDGIRLYHAGDTERVPEMKEIRCDIIMLPLGQTYTMTSVDEAAGAVQDTRARIAIPIHYGLYEGTVDDARKFGEMMKKQNITVLQGN